jgi:disulfide bond formation protein DsbB
MVNWVATAMPTLVLISHGLLIALFISILIGRSSWVGKRSIKLAAVVSILTVVGSLFYSNVIGFAPCVLCWWQRIFLFPMPLIFGVALWKKRSDVFSYIVPLAIGALLVASYHSLFEVFGLSLSPCTAVGGSCSKVYVKEFGYITIPVMSLTSALFILLLAWAKRKNTNENSNS